MLRPVYVPGGLVFNPFGIPRQVEPMAHNFALNDYVPLAVGLGDTSGLQIGAVLVVGVALLGLGAMVVSLSKRRTGRRV